MDSAAPTTDSITQCSSEQLRVKHIVEHDIEYVANGEFIAAMLSVATAITKDGPNAWFDVSKRPVKAVDGKRWTYRRESCDET